MTGNDFNNYFNTNLHQLIIAIFFLMDGHKLLEDFLFYMPLKNDDERKLLDSFTSVTRAAIKGAAIIGLIQGGASGIAFAAVDIPISVKK